MKKNVSFCKRYSPEILFALVFGALATLAVYDSYHCGILISAVVIFLVIVAVLLLACLVFHHFIIVKDIPAEEKIRKYGSDFDVLCEIDGQRIRVPFEKKDEGTPIGIFPFSDSNTYIELSERLNKKHSDKDVDVRRLPDVGFCGRVAKVNDRLNVCFKALNSPTLEGAYLADNSYMQGAGWIVAFKSGKNTVSSDYYGGKTPAKLRYCGRFYRKDKL